MHSPTRYGDPRALIRELRKRRGFSSDRALALAAGVSQPTLARFLNGSTDSMDVQNLRALAEVLEVSMSELLGEVPLSSGGHVREMAELMERLPERQRRVLLAAARAMLEEPDPSKWLSGFPC